jgi:hypothetical protein
VLLLSYPINTIRCVASLAEQKLCRATNASRAARNCDNEVTNRSNAGANSDRNEAGTGAKIDNRSLNVLLTFMLVIVASSKAAVGRCKLPPK